MPCLTECNENLLFKEAAVIHLDINPSNIMVELDPDGLPKVYRIIDLGVSQQWGDLQSSSAPANLQFASLGAIQGSDVAPWADHESFAYSLLHLQGLSLPWETETESMEVSFWTSRCARRRRVSWISIQYDATSTWHVCPCTC